MLNNIQIGDVHSYFIGPGQVLTHQKLLRNPAQDKLLSKRKKRGHSSFSLATGVVLGYCVAMPRTARASVGDQVYHALNRGNARKQVFFKAGDYQAFLKALGHACQELPMRVLGLCLMPNHFHLVLWPHRDGDLSRWMHWLLNAHVRRYHQHYHSSGHLWQGRFKAFPIASDEHLLTVLRYVERNPVRAGLVERAEYWPWSSAQWWRPGSRCPVYGAVGPVPRPSDWLGWVNQPLTEAELRAVRNSVDRGAPFGPEKWVREAADRLGLQATLRPKGRPRKADA
jgi:putative transposase